MSLSRHIPRRHPSTGRLPWLATVMLLVVLPSGAVNGRDAAPTDPNKVKAAYLRNFAHYVTWPASVFTTDDSPWRIGILGDDPFGEVLENTFKDRTEQGRTFQIFRADTLEKLPACQIIFVAYRDAAKRRSILAELKQQPVLTAGDAPEFLQEGGIVQFRVRNRVEIGVNLDQARAVSLKIQIPMLEVAREVLENGTMSKLR